MLVFVLAMLHQSPAAAMDQFPSRDRPSRYTRPLPEDLFPKDLSWAIDKSQPSNRRTNSPYQPGKNYVTVIDGFVVSPDVEVESAETVDLHFEDSDHQPVVIHVSSR
jgi:hypothetical protein